MKECPKDCLSCSESYSVPADESESGEDELFCMVKQKIVLENEYCDNYN